MKSVEVNGTAASYIEELRAKDMESLHLAKASVADGMSVLARLLREGRDNKDIAFLADGIISIMHTLAEYNFLIEMLYDEGDELGPAMYCLEDTCSRGKEVTEL